MIYLIDYENVKNEGMRGARLLKENDGVIVFFSQNSCNMQKQYLTAIEKSNCYFEICKLVNIGKNALDFYITSKLGELVGKGCEDQVAIISKDQGFKAVKDYWKSRTIGGREIVLAPRIEDAMLQIVGEDMRKKLITEDRLGLDISNFYSIYNERKRIKKILDRLFKNTEYEFCIQEIGSMIENEYTPKVMYIESLKKFGRKNGLHIYQVIKTERNELLGEVIAC